jgi:Replication-relaxation
MELVPRDLEILGTVGELGTADTEILRTLHFPKDTTGRAAQQRCRKLTDEELLKRVRLIAVDGDMRGGSLPMLYFLTEAGADLVERETGRRPRRVTHSDPKPLTLRHRIDTIRARRAIDEAAKLAAIPVPEWIMEQDTRGNPKAMKGHSPSEFLVLCNRYQHDGHGVSFRPDAACHIQIPHNGGVASLLAYFEVDRSTEGHLQWKRKLAGLEAFIGDPKGWLRHWPTVTNPITRVFVLCKTQRRINELIETIKSSPAAGHIRFTTYPLDAPTVLTGDVWQSCDGEVRRILRAN